MDDLKRSLNIIRLAEADSVIDAAKKMAIDASSDKDFQDVAKTAGAGYATGKIASKVLGKKIPGVAPALYGKDAYDRFQKGDYTGAALQGAGAVASLFPGVGTVASLGADALTAYHDYNTNSTETTDDRYNNLPDDADADIAALQIKLQDMGADVTVDGKPSQELVTLARKYKLMD